MAVCLPGFFVVEILTLQDFAFRLDRIEQRPACVLSEVDGHADEECHQRQ